jgi:hypothetical protein
MSSEFFCHSRVGGNKTIINYQLSTAILNSELFRPYSRLRGNDKTLKVFVKKCVE